MDSEIIYAVILGTLFGFALFKIGAADPDQLMGMLKLQNLHLAKTILAAIGISTIILYSGVLLDLIPMNHFSIKGMYWGVIIGGIIFGLGWAISGFCPGTGMSGLGVGRLDAIAYFIGGLFGVYMFALSYEYLTQTFLYSEVLHGKSSLVKTGNSEYTLFTVSWSPFIAIVIGIALIFIAYKLPKKILD